MTAPRFTAKQLPRQPGPAGWNAILPAPPPARPLEGAQEADVAIIGGGFAGLAAARRIAVSDPGLRVAICEAGRVAEGPAGRNSGFMIDLPHDLASEDYAGDSNDRAQIALNREAIAFNAAAAEEYALSREAFDPAGKVNGAASAEGHAQNLSYSAHLASLGEAHELLDDQAMQELTGTRFYRSGLYTSGTVMIQPAAFVRGVATGLASGSNSVALYERSPVEEIARDGGAWQLRTGAGRLTAPKVILAINGHAESFGFFSRRLMHVFTYASMTRPLTPEEVTALGGAPRWGITPADPLGTTVRRVSGVGGDRIVVRTRFTFEPSMTVGEAAIASAGRLHDAKFAERFPMLAGVSMAYRWAGHLCLSRNGVSAFGEVAQGIFAACCQNGLGTVRGTMAGMGAADAALGRESPIRSALEAEAEPTKLPPEPFATLGARAVLRLKEWRARRE